MVPGTSRLRLPPFNSVHFVIVGGIPYGWMPHQRKSHRCNFLFEEKLVNAGYRVRTHNFAHLRSVGICWLPLAARTTSSAIARLRDLHHTLVFLLLPGATKYRPLIEIANKHVIFEVDETDWIKFSKDWSN